MAAFVTFEDVSKVYHSGEIEIRAVDHISFTIEKGEFCVIVGPSGAGKTTVLNMLGGMDACSGGTITVDGTRVSGFNARQLTTYRRHDIGFVFQFYNLVGNLTALENVELAAQICKDPLNAATVLNEVGLSARANNFPGQLSGGEQQRVSLARALVNNPKVIIADEPTGNVDPEMSHEIVELLTKINNAGTTVIMVTHEHDLVRSFQRRVIVIKNGEVVSDTPDPTHARFESSEPRKETDMFFYEEGTSIDLSKTADARTDEDVFDNLESLADETPAQAAATPEDENGGAAE